MCGERSALHDPHQSALRASPTEDDTLIGNTLYKCTHSLLNSINYTDSKQMAILPLLRRQDSYMQRLASVAPKVAFESALKLKSIWVNLFAHGIPLPPLVVNMLSPHTTHTFRVNNATLQTPQYFTPHSYSVRLPTIRAGQVQWFYLNVQNPYDTHVAFSLLEDAASATTKKMKSLGKCCVMLSIFSHFVIVLLEFEKLTIETYYICQF